MRILVDITHPAHVHFFRNAISLWRQHGHDIAVTARQKDITIDLLNEYGIPFTTLSSIGNHKLSLFKELVVRDFNLYRFCRKFRPDVLTAIGGVFAAHVGFAVRKPVVVWDDTEHAGISHKLTFPFAASIQTPSCYLKILGDKQVFYAGCHELAYLHPNRFSPDRQVVRSLGIDPDEKYAVIRLVSWQAHHDVGQSGFEKKSITDFIETISKYARPYITSEIKLPDALEKYKLKIPFNKIHHVMAFASLCITEGATMASESALLAVPAVYINTLSAGTIMEFEKYGLLHHITDTRKALEKSIDILNNQNSKDQYRALNNKYLANKIDATEYIVATVENFV
jgi:hypothetical protein